MVYAEILFGLCREALTPKGEYKTYNKFYNEQNKFNTKTLSTLIPYIIIPTYNEEAFMSLTLQSLVEQTVLPTKIVVVNDNSTDKTPEIVSEFAYKYPFITLVNKNRMPFIYLK